MSIFLRLFLLLAILSGVPLAAVALLLSMNTSELEQRLDDQNQSLGNHVSTKGTQILEESIKSSHLKIVQEKAKKLAAFFSTISRTVQLESVLITQALTDSGSTLDLPPLWSADEVARRYESDPEFLATVFSQKPYTMFHVAPNVEMTTIAEPMDRLRRLGVFFAHAQQSVPGCNTTYLGHRDGFIFGYPGRSRFPATYDPRQRPWYKEAMARQPQVYMGVHPDKSGTDMFLTCAKAVSLTADKEPVAVAAIDIELTDILAELFAVSDLKVSGAILLDEDNRVRVSADYRDAAVQFDKQTTLQMPLVSELKDPGFARVAGRIHASPAVESGVAWDSEEEGQSGNLFIYSAVKLGTTERSATEPPTHSAESHQWYYIVQLPLGPLIQPIRDVRSEVDDATRGISEAIAGESRKSARVILGISLAAVLTAILLAFLSARATTRPLIQMADVAHKIGDGDLNQKVVVTSRDEVGQLGTAINAMIDGLKERDFVKGTFKRYVSSAVVDRILKDRKVSLGGVKRTLTVFFSNLKGFTTLSEQLSPEVLIQVLNEYLSVMTDSLLATEGTLDKYIGDAILAFWGDPISHEDDALRACRTALQHNRQLKQLWERWDEQGLPRLEMRIGIQTGPVIVGNVGSSIQMNYTVMGDTVNLASRLESANKFYGTRIMIGEETRRQAGDAIEVRELDLLAVKGKHNAVRVYELLGLAGEIAEEHRSGFQEYEIALAAHRERRWDDAEASLRRALSILNKDLPTELLLERIAQYRLHPPSENWDGSFVLTEK